MPKKLTSNFPKSQQGASVSGIVVMIALAALLIKLGLAIVPTYIGEYQLRKLIAKELKQTNDEHGSERDFMQKLDRQMGINANYNTKAADVVKIINKTPGALTAKMHYKEESNFFGDTYIVTRFDKTITAADAK